MKISSIRLSLLGIALFLSGCTSDSSSGGVGSDKYSLTVQVTDAVSERPDDLKCSAVKLDPEEAYILKFTPHASKETAHHMVIYGCPMPSSNDTVWRCDKDDEGVEENGVCAGGARQILFAWALDAPEKALPEGVGLRVSGTTNINYLVVQLHYAKKFQPGVTDSSGVTLQMTHKRPPQQVGYIILGNWGYIPPQEPDYRLDSICEYQHDYTIYPIGYRTHSHNLGVVSSGYRVREGKWTEIGRMSPQRPQTFYEVTNPGMDVRKGDYLAGRCTMNSMNRTSETVMGATNHDEMCNFYIMYSTYAQENLRTEYCFKGHPGYDWAHDPNLANTEIPKDASSLEGIEGAEEIKRKFGLS